LERRELRIVREFGERVWVWFRIPGGVRHLAGDGDDEREREREREREKKKKKKKWIKKWKIKLKIIFYCYRER
jgi:hypothetical protein